MNKALPYIVAAVLGLCGAQALAQSQAEGQQACGNDAFALCQDAIPDTNRIAACLRKNFSHVSAPCRQYMASYGKSHREPRYESRRHHERYSERRHHHHEHYSESHHKRQHHRSHDEG
jgi:hypothetical protein